MRRIASSIALTLLTCPLAFVSLPTIADECASGTCLGPNNPIMMDGSTNGTPDTPVPIVPATPTVFGGDAAWQVVLPWDCGNSTSQDVIEGKHPGDGIFRRFIRANHDLNQRLDVIETTPSGAVTKAEFKQYFYWDEGASDPSAEGTFELLDTNGDGSFDTMRLLGGGLAVTSNLAGIDTTGDGNADYVTMPWANALTFHNPDSGCGANGGAYIPQISIPLTDTDGDGKPDSVVLDLDGDNQADPGFTGSPKLQTVPNRPPYSVPVAELPAPDATPVPTLPAFALILLLLAIAATGWAGVRRNFSG